METPEIFVDSRAAPARRCYVAIIMLRLPPMLMGFHYCADSC